MYVVIRLGNPERMPNVVAMEAAAVLVASLPALRGQGKILMFSFAPSIVCCGRCERVCMKFLLVFTSNLTPGAAGIPPFPPPASRRAFAMQRAALEQRAAQDDQDERAVAPVGPNKRKADSDGVKGAILIRSSLFLL